MRSSPLVLFPPDTLAGEAWRVGRAVEERARVEPLRVAGDASPSVVGAAVAAVGGGPVTLALPSSMCLAAMVDTAGLPRQGRRSAQVYRLELSLPLAAEEVAADFLPHPREASALGIAVAVDAVRPWVEALEAAGVAVAAICPAGLLAIDRPGDGLLAWGHGSAIDLFSVVDGQVTNWFTLPAEVDDVRPYLPAVAGGDVRWVDVPDAVAEVIGGTRASADWATAATAAVLSGRRARVDLARDGLAPRGRATAARRAMVGVGIAAAVFVGACCGGMLWRAQGYQRLTDGQVEQQQRIFQQLFPGRAVPADVRSRLGSEARGLALPTSDTGGGPSALAMLHGLLSHMPADVRFQLTEVRVGDGQIHVEGTVPTRSDADALAAAAREGTGVAVETPQTNQDGPRAVHFVLTGSASANGGGT
jgi:type II secretory pathway component PulL